MSLPLEVVELFREVFDDEELIVTEGTRATDIDGWDSLMHINLMIAIERVFNIKFATAEIARLKEDDQSVADLMRVIDEKGQLQR